MTRGRFITFEGGEGAGKSTHVRLLAAELRDAGTTVLTTREPGGAPGAEAIRALLLSGELDGWDGMTEVLLHFAARREHLVTTIRPALARGDWVISDRFADSTRAYQGYGLGVDQHTIDKVYAIAVGDFTPDLTLILDLPAEDGLARARSRGADDDRYERMDLEFHRRLRDGFLDIARADPDRCVVIDARQDLDDVARNIMTVVRERLVEQEAGAGDIK